MPHLLLFLTLTITRDENDVFRLWASSEDYKAFESDLRAGPLFAKNAEAEKEEIFGIWEAMGISRGESEKMPLPLMLDNLTYIKELMDCETFKDGEDSKNLAFSINSKLSRSQKSTVNRLARWCWNQRYFNAKLRYLGKPFLHRLIIDIDRSPESFIVYSGHDYSILCLLNTLGFEEYPEHVLSYGSYVMLQVYETDAPKESNTPMLVKITYNTRPFENKKGAKETDIQFYHAKNAPLKICDQNGLTNINVLRALVKQ